MNPFWAVSLNTFIITVFVAMMMLMVEYLNVFSHGFLVNSVLGGRWRGYLLGTVLGLVPGCLGSFAMVSLFAHRRTTVGAIVATMIATSGDEAFVMMSLFPGTALAMFAAMAVIGIAAGWLTDQVILRGRESRELLDCNFLTHPAHERISLRPGDVRELWRRPSAVRGILSVTIGIFLLIMFALKLGIVDTGHHHPDHGTRADTHPEIDVPGEPHDADAEDDALFRLPAPHAHGTGGWTWYTLVILLVFSLFVIATVSDHFLEEHLWDHVLKTHVPRIFLWTLGALTAMEVLNHFMDLHVLLSQNLWLVLAVAVVIGVIPESGPHLIFVTLFAAGAIPLSILMASSIVQDGHGMLPMLAHSRRDFVTVKLINVTVGALVGAAMLLAGI